MRARLLHLVLIASLGIVPVAEVLWLVPSQRALAADADGDPNGAWAPNDDGRNAPGTILQLPSMPPVRIGPGAHIFGNESFPRPALKRHALKPSLSPAERAKAAKAEALKRAMAPQKSHAAIRAELLDNLFKRLSKASNIDEATGVAGVIERVWLHTDSPTARLLMTRGLAALEAGHLPLALQLFDQIVVLQPDWAAAWDKRAATRLIGGDLDGAISDMEHTLKLEPRQFLALSALGFVLERQGLDKRALAAFRKSLALDPQQPEIKEAVDKLSLKVEGRDI